MVPELADQAYAHALAVTGDSAIAAQLAAQALRLGGRSPSAVLAHVRHAALAVAGSAGGPDVDRGGGVTGDDLAALARALTMTRPPEERAVVDLDTRHGLDRRGVARALGVTPANAAARAAAVSAAWERELDPALLARMGPGGCGALAGILESRGLWRRPFAVVPASGLDRMLLSAPAGGDGTPSSVANGTPSSVAGAPSAASSPGVACEVEPVAEAGESTRPPLAQLLAAAAHVAAHLEECGHCADRARAMVSVRALLARVPLEPAPEAVRRAGAGSRLRRPAPPPPPIGETGRAGRSARPLVGAAVVVAVVSAAGILMAATQRQPSDRPRVDALAMVPAPGQVLLAEPVVTEGPASAVRLTNGSSRDLSWRSEPPGPGLTTVPSEGRLSAGGSVVLEVVALDRAREGERRATVTVVADDGSTAVARVIVRVERPPDVDATVRGCTVTARVEDEGELGPVLLRWRAESEGSEPLSQTMSQSGEWFTATLPASPWALTWWVGAADLRGNQSETTAELLPPGSC